MGTKVILRPGGEQSISGSFNLTTPDVDGVVASGLETTGDPVDVASAAPPVAGQVATALDATHMVWRVPGLRYDPAVRFNVNALAQATIEPGTWGFVYTTPPAATGITVSVVSSLSSPPVDSRFGLYVSPAVILPVTVQLVGASQIMGLDGVLGPSCTLLPGAMYEWVFYHEDSAAIWGLVSDTTHLADTLATSTGVVNIGASAAPAEGQVPIASDANNAAWGYPRPLQKVSTPGLLRNQWQYSSDASGAVVAPAAGAGDAFGVYMDGSVSATVTARAGQFIISPEGPETDLRVSPPSSITLNKNAYYEWVMLTDQGWRPRIAPVSPITPYRFAARVVATSNVVLSGLQTIDTVALVANDRALLVSQTSAAENGPYLVSAGAWRRTADADRSAMFRPTMIVPVTEGSAANRDSLWMLTTDGAITLGTTALAFSKIAGGATTAGPQIDTKMLSSDGPGDNTDLTQLGFSVAAGETVICEWFLQIDCNGVGGGPGSPILRLSHDLAAFSVSRCNVYNQWTVGTTITPTDQVITTLQTQHAIQQVSSVSGLSYVHLIATLTTGLGVFWRPFVERVNGLSIVKRGSWGRCTRGAVIS